MRPAEACAGLDPAALAAVARRLGALLPTPSPDPGWSGWAGRGAGAAQRAAADPVRIAARVRWAFGEAGDALAGAAAALAEVQDLVLAASRLASSQPSDDGQVGDSDPIALAALARLRQDATDLLARADRQCADRLRALVGAVVPDLPRLVPVTSVETVASAVARLDGWAVVPAALVGVVAALDAVDAAAPPARREAPATAAPVAAREIAARLVLADHPALLEPAPDGTERQYLLAGSGGRIAEVWGDIRTAERVVVLVPGTHTREGHFGGAAQQGDATYDEMRWQAGDGVAVVSWLGSPAPPSIPAAALQTYAHRAAPLLRDFVEALPTAPGARLTLVGHSYGAVVAGMAVRGGLRPAALVGVAPAGFGPGVHDTSDLGGVPTYVIESADDPIEDEYAVQGALQDLLPIEVDRLAGWAGIGHLGDDPIHLPGAVRLPTGDDDRRRPLLSFDLAVHDQYFTPGGTSLQQIVAVAVGPPIPERPSAP